MAGDSCLWSKTPSHFHASRGCGRRTGLRQGQGTGPRTCFGSVGQKQKGSKDVQTNGKDELILINFVETHRLPDMHACMRANSSNASKASKATEAQPRSKW